MYRKLADTITLDFTVHLPTTGAVSDADALPTVEIWEDDTDTTLAGGTVTKRVDKTGNYRVAVVATAANGFEVGKSYNVVVTAIAGGITAKAVVGSFFIDSKRHGDLNDLGGTAQSGDAYAQLGVAGANLTALGDTRIANLDAAISTVRTGILEGTLTLEQALRIILSAVAGRSSGIGTSTVVTQDQAHSKPRITATIDASGNRTNIVVDGS